MNGPRFALALVAGWLCFSGVLTIDFAVVRAIWGAYAEADPDRAYTLSMLFVRLLVFGTAISATAILTTRVVRDVRMPWIAGTLILLGSIPQHFYPGTVWEYYPAWYHYSYLASILPIAVAAGRLAIPASRGEPHA